MRRIVILVVLAALLTAGVAPSAAQSRPLRYVIIMSFDGLRPDALRQVMPAGLLARAAYSWDAKTTLPSSTMPSHASMLSGVGPDVHTVRFNDWRPSRGYFRLATVFSVTTASGKTSAAFVTKSKLLFFARPGTVAHAEHLQFPAYDQTAATRAAMRYLTRAQPHLLFIHLADPDDAGHAHGWMSAPYMAAVRKVPDTIGIVLDVLNRMLANDQSLVIVTADHGGHRRTHGTADPQDVTIPWLAFGAVEPGPVRRTIMTYDTAATALAALGLSIPASWRGQSALPVGRNR